MQRTGRQDRVNERVRAWENQGSFPTQLGKGVRNDVMERDFCPRTLGIHGPYTLVMLNPLSADDDNTEAWEKSITPRLLL
jgi:hypothetical protein